MLESLGYVTVAGADLDEWSGFATELLGMQVGERTRTSLTLRMDDEPMRLLLSSASTGSRYAFGWEVADAASLDAIEQRLGRRGISVVREPAGVAAQRGVQALISFQDPVGNGLEVFSGRVSAGVPFAPSRPISGFRTGALGLGHVVLTVESVAAVAPFYEEVLGFRLSDFTLAPFKGFFYHVNPRHHSLALIETGVNGLHHVMVELKSLDDVGQTYDLAQYGRDCVGVTLGRHSNDLMTSFYAASPSSFLVEYGWGGRSIDPSNWKPEEYTIGPSLWGHERSWLPPDKLIEARELRLKAAALGYRAPVQVLEGAYTVMSDPKG